MEHLWRVRSLKPAGPWIYFQCPPGAPVGPHLVAGEIVKRKSRQLSTAPDGVRLKPTGKKVRPWHGWDVPTYHEAKL